MSPARKQNDKAAGTDETATCPWCSATVPVTAVKCPSCGASLRDAADGEVAGVTQIDPAAIARVRRIKPRRLTSWLTGDGSVDDESGGTVEPPTEEVRREMLRIELAAIDAELETKSQQAAAQRDLPLDDAAVDTPGPTDAPGAKSG
jgi:ssDNA-binding Zn-finger/Zn-ribbon topoisomerase 1